MSLLDRLMAKPVPQAAPKVTILSRKDDPVAEASEGLTVDIPIVNLTHEGNREDLLKRFASRIERPMKEVRPDVEDDIEPVSTVLPEPKPKTTKPVRKIGRKLKLVEESPAAFDKPDESDVVKPARKPRKQIKGIADAGPLSMLKIGTRPITERLKEKEPSVIIRAPSYYMNNREIFISFINSLFAPFKDKMQGAEGTASCDSAKSDNQGLFTHQEIVRDYINLYTPYRGLLLFHGLGSGKTCASIGIAEGIKHNKKVYIMTPASLQANYRADLKKCGDPLYKKNQFWEFVPIKRSDVVLRTLSTALSLPMEWIKKNKGAWMVNVTKESNFASLSADEKSNLDSQLNEMINSKYHFINYNGMRNSHLALLTNNYTINPFDNAVVVVDEAHNFVSRIVNKINKPESLSYRLYQLLMSATGARIVLLSGTPIINYPNEIAILYNILRGKMKSWYFKLSVSTQRKISDATLRSLFAKFDVLDYIEYRPSSSTLVVTKNPYGFYTLKSSAGTNKGVTLGDRGDVDDEGFVSIITSILQKNDIKIVPGATRVESFKALPDTLDGFSDYFIDPKTSDLKNAGLFKRRILGLTSYLEGQEQLMPRFTKAANFHIIKIPMSDFQFGVYEEARIQERKLEKNNARKKKVKKGGDEVYQETVSTYRIFSRAFCNFVFPRPAIVRPMPRDGMDIEATLKLTADEDLLDAISVEEKLQNVDGRFTADELEKEDDAQDGSYDERINKAMAKLEKHASKYLSPEGLETYSPKFLTMLDNIQDTENKGLHLVYSQFRTLEGIGIFSLVLKTNGFAQFKIKKDANGNWSIETSEEDAGKPMFALYTGTETIEEKEIIRNIFNGNWDLIPTNLAEELRKTSSNNLYGEVIKVLMITASGAEGINLENVRYVHLTEPYWHPVRLEQVIGRARRICSHKNLPKELQTVEAFLYLMEFSEEQLASDQSIELRLQDKSRIDKVTPLTTDQSLYEIATIKEDINKQILKAVKEASIDCALHQGKSNKEKLKCFSFGRTSAKSFAFTPSIADEESDSISDINRAVLKIKAVEVTIQGIKYAYNKSNGDVYDLDSYERGDPITIGKLKVDGGKYLFTKI